MESYKVETGRERSVVDRFLHGMGPYRFFITISFVQKVFAKQFQYLRMKQNQSLQRAIFNSNKIGLVCHQKQHTSNESLTTIENTR